jgi:hypothetical protein
MDARGKKTIKEERRATKMHSSMQMIQLYTRFGSASVAAISLHFIFSCKLRRRS